MMVSTEGLVTRTPPPSSAVFRELYLDALSEYLIVDIGVGGVDVGCCVGLVKIPVIADLNEAMWGIEI